MGFQLRPLRGVRRRATATPAWSTSPRSPRTLHAPLDKIHPMPFPGLNIDNLPFFAVIAAVRRGPDAAPRLGLREPRDLPHRAQQARRPGQAARPAPGADRGPDPLVAAPRSSARRRCARPSSSCWRCWPRKGTSVLRSSTSSTAATRTSPSGSTRSAPDRDLPRHLTAAGAERRKHALTCTDVTAGSPGSLPSLIPRRSETAPQVAPVVNGVPYGRSRTARSARGAARVTVAVRVAPTAGQAPSPGARCSRTMTTTARGDSTAWAV